MTGTAECGELRLALGVYVVGAIDPAERAAVDAHLSHCPECREELAGLAGLPALLGRVPRAEVERMEPGAEVPEEPPGELLDSLLQRVAVRRRSHRWRMAAAAAAAAVIAIGGGIAVGHAVIDHPASPPAAAQQPAAQVASASNPATGVAATVYYTTSASGMTIKVKVTGVKPGTMCQFWVNTKAGQNTLAGTWVAGPSGTSYPAASRYTAAQVKSFDLSTGNRHKVVTIPVT